MKNIVVVGSVNLDYGIDSPAFPLRGETINGSGFTKKIGGKGFNQYIVSSNIDKDTIFIGSVGGDDEGRLILDYMDKHSLDSEYLQVSQASTTGVAMILRSDSENMIVIEQGANRDVSLDRVKEALKKLKPSYIILQLEIPINIVEGVIEVAHELGIKTVLNTAPAQAIDNAIWSKIDYLILNQTETQFFTDIMPVDYDTSIVAGKKLISYGVKNVVITLGAHGAVFYNNKTSLMSDSYKIKPIDSTGAGDAFVGAFVASLSQGLNIEEALRYANATGALTCLNTGAVDAIPTKEAIEKFIEEKKL